MQIRKDKVRCYGNIIVTIILFLGRAVYWSRFLLIWASNRIYSSKFREK